MQVEASMGRLSLIARHYSERAICEIVWLFATSISTT